MVLKRYKWVIDWIAHVELWISTLLLVALLLVVMMEVTSRYLLNRPFPWVQELTMLMITYIVFLGIPAMYRHKSLVIIEFLFNRLPVQVKQYIAIIWEILIGFFLVYLIGSAYDLQELQSRYTSPTLDISFRYFTIPVLLCAASMFLFNIYFIIGHLSCILGKGKEVHGEW